MRDMSFIRAHLQNIEQNNLSKYAMLSTNSRGRLRDECESDTRTVYQRDKDRIIHSKAFRRLMNKTQVFLAPESDHYRTRLTHTLEVAQIARGISRALSLNEDLTEAIALGHDLGHTPFGHAGEAVLDSICPIGFKHYQQSGRIVDILENDHRGLNLTFEVRDGIVNHTTGVLPQTLEGCVVRLSDRIAYINHDIDDATRGGIIEENDIPDDIKRELGNTGSERINTMIRSTVDASWDSDRIVMHKNVQEATSKLHDFMFERVYTDPVAKGEEGKAKQLIAELYNYYLKYPQSLPPEYYSQLETEDPCIVVCDYIAGMTDRYAIQRYTGIFLPKTWQG